MKGAKHMKDTAMVAITTVLLLVAGMAAYNTGRTVTLQAAMQTACESHKPQCLQLIHKVQAGGHWQVYANAQGKYWTEAE